MMNEEGIGNLSIRNTEKDVRDDLTLPFRKLLAEARRIACARELVLSGRKYVRQGAASRCNNRGQVFSVDTPRLR